MRDWSFEKEVDY
jgi:hypothetical protein